MGEGIEGLVHISELAERHVDIPEQVVSVGEEITVKVIDIDLDRRRISLSLKQANEGMTVDTEFDPTRYGMAAEYDDQGNYIYPEGFDVETGDWKEGFESQRETWEKEYAEAHSRYEQHIAQIRKAAEADAEAEKAEGETNPKGADTADSEPSAQSADAAAEEAAPADGDGERE